MAQPTGPIVGATNKPPGSVKLGVGAEIRPVAPPGIADFRHRRDIVRNGAGGRGIMYGVYGRKKKRKMSVLLAFCHTFMYCIYPPQEPITVGDLEYSILIDQDKGEKMFFKSILPKIGIILIYSLVIESGLEAGFPSLTD